MVLCGNGNHDKLNIQTGEIVNDKPTFIQEV